MGSYSKEFTEWKNNLKPRKQCLEEEFQHQLEEQERHYGHYLIAALAAERNRTPSRDEGYNRSKSRYGSVKEPAPFLPAAAATTFLAATSFLRASFTRTEALSASATLLLATTYLRMAWREDPFLSLRALMAATIM